MSLIREAVSAGARLGRACEVAGISVRSFQRWLQSTQDRRKGPSTAPSHRLSNEEEIAALQLANRPGYRNLSPEAVVAKAADSGEFICSERTLRRILKRHKQDNFRGRARPATESRKPQSYVADGPLQVLSWDITYLKNSRVRGGYFFLYLYVDIWSRCIVGWSIHEEQTSEKAAALLRQVCLKHNIEANSTVLHQDNGAPMKGATFLATLDALGITKSFSRPGVSDDNAYIESLFRHLKYVPSFPKTGFDSIQAARAWVEHFVQWYNHQHLHRSIGMVTPHDRHTGQDIAILAQRREVYALAHQRNPRRWARCIRSWARPLVVSLNPERTLEVHPAANQGAA